MTRARSVKNARDDDDSQYGRRICLLVRTSANRLLAQGNDGCSGRTESLMGQGE